MSWAERIALASAIFTALGVAVAFTVATREKRRERAELEPLVAFSPMAPAAWPKGYIWTHVSIENRNNFALDVYRIALKRPLWVRAALMPPDTLKCAPKPEALSFVRTIDLNALLLQPDSGVDHTGRPKHTIEIILALSVPCGCAPIQITAVVEASQAQRHRRPMKVPSYVYVPRSFWNGHREDDRTV